MGLGEKLKIYPAKPSGGQKLRMSIARALAMSLAQKVFDESDSALDLQLVGEVLDTLKMLSDKGMIMFLVTYEIRVARHVEPRHLLPRGPNP